jgi:hypothetical protein
MKVLHVVSEPGPAGRGVPQKVRRTVEAWRRLGIDADFIELSTGRLGVPGTGGGDSFRPRFRAEWILEMHRRAKRARRVLAEIAPDLIYTRELVWSPGLKSLFEDFRVVIEVNSDRGEELRSRSWLASAFWRITAPGIRRRAAGLVCVTGELASRVGSPGVPSAVIGNAVDVPAEPPRRSTPSNRPLVLMLVGGAAPWQGVDRFAALSRALPEFEFAVCGDVGPDLTDLPDSLRILEARSGSDLEELLAGTTVAFGTLALSRKGMIEACPLKSRTSLAAGIPIVYAYDDPVLRGDEPFALRIEDREIQTPAAIDEIRGFIRAASERPSMGVEAWEFARRKLDVGIAEGDRIRFFESILA